MRKSQNCLHIFGIVINMLIDFKYAVRFQWQSGGEFITSLGTLVFLETLMERNKKNDDNSLKITLQQGILSKSNKKQDSVKNSAHSGYYILTRGSLECYQSRKLVSFYLL